MRNIPIPIVIPLKSTAITSSIFFSFFRDSVKSHLFFMNKISFILGIFKNAMYFYQKKKKNAMYSKEPRDWSEVMDLQ